MDYWRTLVATATAGGVVLIGGSGQGMPSQGTAARGSRRSQNCRHTARFKIFKRIFIISAVVGYTRHGNGIGPMGFVTLLRNSTKPHGSKKRAKPTQNRNPPIPIGPARRSYSSRHSFPASRAFARRSAAFFPSPSTVPSRSITRRA